MGGIQRDEGYDTANLLAHYLIFCLFVAVLDKMKAFEQDRPMRLLSVVDTFSLGDDYFQ